jgi:hypothetical protein
MEGGLQWWSKCVMLMLNECVVLVLKERGRVGSVEVTVVQDQVHLDYVYILGKIPGEGTGTVSVIVVAEPVVVNIPSLGAVYGHIEMRRTGSSVLWFQSTETLRGFRSIVDHVSRLGTHLYTLSLGTILGEMTCRLSLGLKKERSTEI